MNLLEILDSSERVQVPFSSGFNLCGPRVGEVEVGTEEDDSLRRLKNSCFTL